MSFNLIGYFNCLKFILNLPQLDIIFVVTGYFISLYYILHLSLLDNLFFLTWYSIFTRPGSFFVRYINGTLFHSAVLEYPCRGGGCLIEELLVTQGISKQVHNNDDVMVGLKVDLQSLDWTKFPLNLPSRSLPFSTLLSVVNELPSFQCPILFSIHRPLGDAVYMLQCPSVVWLSVGFSPPENPASWWTRHFWLKSTPLIMVLVFEL